MKPNLASVLRLGKKSPQLVFAIKNHGTELGWGVLYITFPEYELGTRRNSQIVNRRRKLLTVFPVECNKGRRPEMAIKTGNMYISGTTTNMG